MPHGNVNLSFGEDINQAHAESPLVIGDTDNLSPEIELLAQRFINLPNRNG